jgi:diacylglycerol kinase
MAYCCHTRETALFCYTLPMRRIKKSFGHAIDGLVHAIKMERNLKLFIPVYLIILICGIPVVRLLWEWIALLMAGGLFLSIELLNTSLERLIDVLDDQKKLLGGTHYHGIKAAKDVAAAASLVSLLMLIAVLVLVFWPYLKLYVGL